MKSLYNVLIGMLSGDWVYQDPRGAGDAQVSRGVNSRIRSEIGERRFKTFTRFMDHNSQDKDFGQLVCNVYFSTSGSEGVTIDGFTRTLLDVHEVCSSKGRSVRVKGYDMDELLADYFSHKV